MALDLIEIDVIEPDLDVMQFLIIQHDIGCGSLEFERYHVAIL